MTGKRKRRVAGGPKGKHYPGMLCGADDYHTEATLTPREGRPIPVTVITPEEMARRAEALKLRPIPPDPYKLEAA